jgi:hypothetical protein
MAAVSIGSWLAATAIFGAQVAVETLAGMIGPLTVAASTWLMAERTYRQQPERLTAVMITAFAGKMVFFGAYVTIALTVLSLRPVPFVVSFTGYFIGLYAIEALCLRHLFAGNLSSDRRHD